MEWRDEALVVACHWHGEHAAILSVLTKERGVWRGLVHGAHGKKTRALIQLGFPLTVTHRARTADQLGVFRLDASPHCGFSYRLHRGHRLAMQSSACALVALLCPEHQPHEAIFSSLCDLFMRLANNEAEHHYVAWEYDLLRHLGYGMDISRCALSHETSGETGVSFVSKKSGRGIHASQMQEKWRSHVLPVPAFLSHYAQSHHMKDDSIDAYELKQGLSLTGYFLQQCALHRHRPLPQVRRLIMRVPQPKAGNHTRASSDTKSAPFQSPSPTSER